MKTLLHIDCSPLGDASISRHLSGEFVKRWAEANPEGKIVRRDLCATHIPLVEAAWVAAALTPEESRTPAQRELLRLSDELIEELKTADEYAFGVPMHNFGIPAAMKLWLDQIVRVGKTFAYVDGAPTGLLKGKKAQFLIASGGVYDPGSGRESFNFVGPYLRTIFGFIGVTDTAFLHAGGTSALMFGKIDRDSFLEPHVTKIDSLFQTTGV
jgi:FMN-dependent NADH-azoreductase